MRILINGRRATLARSAARFERDDPPARRRRHVRQLRGQLTSSEQPFAQSGAFKRILSAPASARRQSFRHVLQAFGVNSVEVVHMTVIVWQ
jgi:hypothetical protein